MADINAPATGEAIRPENRKWVTDLNDSGSVLVSESPKLQI